MHLRLLGPPELVVDGRSADLGGPRQRIVLSLLALNAHRVTSVEHLLDAVWGDDPPSTARGQIQICISALRKLFPAADRIRTQPPGYALVLEPDELDIDVFDTLVGTAASTPRRIGRSRRSPRCGPPSRCGAGRRWPASTAPPSAGRPPGWTSAGRPPSRTCCGSTSPWAGTRS
jgi:hypothetical protein